MMHDASASNDNLREEVDKNANPSPGDIPEGHAATTLSSTCEGSNIAG